MGLLNWWDHLEELRREQRPQEQPALQLPLPQRQELPKPPPQEDDQEKTERGVVIIPLW